MLEAFSVDKGGFRVRSCDENLLTKQGKPHIHVEICAINPDDSIYTVAYFVNGTAELRVTAHYYDLAEDEDLQLAMKYACSRLGINIAEIATS